MTDVATLLGVIQSPFGAVAGQPLPQNYTQFVTAARSRARAFLRDPRLLALAYDLEQELNVRRQPGASAAWKGFLIKEGAGCWVLGAGCWVLGAGC